jgi:ribokinase
MGGKGANQAVAAARLGARVAFVARVGNDTFGLQAIDQYRAEGIDTSFVVLDDERPTGTAAILVDDRAENYIIVAPNANAALSPDDIRRASSVIVAADVVLCQFETPIDTAIETMRIARDAGRRTILTPAPAMGLRDDWPRLCDVCVPNVTELELLTGRHLENLDDILIAARFLQSRGIATVVVTLGSRGAMIVSDDPPTHIPAMVVDAIDPTGAGDALTGALAYEWGRGQTLRDAVTWATTVAAMTVSRLGTQTAFPNHAEIDAWLANR